MTPEKLIDTLNTTRHEIISLQTANNLLNAKLEGIEMAMFFLNATPPTPRPISYMPDVVHDIDKAIATLQPPK